MRDEHEGEVHRPLGGFHVLRRLVYSGFQVCFKSPLQPLALGGVFCLNELVIVFERELGVNGNDLIPDEDYSVHYSAVVERILHLERPRRQDVFQERFEVILA